MKIDELLKKYCFHDSLINEIIYANNEVTITIDFCFWMQEGYQDGTPETGIIHLRLPDVNSYNGITGEIDSYSILEMEYNDNTLSILIMDDFHNTSYSLTVESASGQALLQRESD